VLGTQQANLRVLPRADGLTNVFATCEHSSLIYSSEGRIIYSAVTAEDATFICPFNAAAYPDAIVVATASEIKISQIDTERRTHVRTLPMGETVRRVAYSPSEKVFGLGTIKRDLVNGEEIIESSFRLVDEIVFSELGKPFQLGIPQGDELVETVIRAALPNTYGSPQERFIVGTSFLDDNPALSFRGRILVFGVDSSRNPYKIAEYKVKGACRCLGVLDGKIVAALVKTVVVFEYTELSSSSAKLEKVASYRTSTCPVDLAIEGNTIAVADLMKSVSIVEYRPGTGGEAPTLVEVARHFQSVWATAVAHVDEGWLEADADGNLIVLRRNEAGVTLEDRKKMEVTGEFHLGEQVNRIRKIRVDASEDATVVPRAFLATVRFLFLLLCALANISTG
jgi:DNA damage-binding protein 1